MPNLGHQGGARWQIPLALAKPGATVSATVTVQDDPKRTEAGNGPLSSDSAPSVTVRHSADGT
jgi:hypothetical protein